MMSSMSRHSVLCHDSGARSCVATRWDSGTTEVFCRYRLGTVVKKKKKGPPRYGALHIPAEM